MYDKRQLQIGSKLKVEQVKKDDLSPDGKVDETIAVSFFNRTPTFGS